MKNQIGQAPSLHPDRQQPARNNMQNNQLPLFDAQSLMSQATNLTRTLGQDLTDAELPLDWEEGTYQPHILTQASSWTDQH